MRACTADEVFDENMVGSVEAFLSRDGVGAAGFETHYIVTASGTEVITTSPNFWW